MIADLRWEQAQVVGRPWLRCWVLLRGYAGCWMAMGIHAGAFAVAAVLVATTVKVPSMDLHIKKVWLPGAASCVLFFGFYWVLIWLPFDKNRFQFMALPYLVLPLVGALGACCSRRMKGSVRERIVSALFPVVAFIALFAVRIVYGLFFEGAPYTLPHFLGGLAVTLVFIVAGGLLLILGAWPFCRPHLKEQLP